MEKIIEQIEIKGIFKRQIIQVFANKILISKKSLTDFYEYEIALDEIDTKKTIKTESNNNLMALGFLLAVVGIIVNSVGATILFAGILVLSLTLITVGIFKRKKTITILSYSNAPIILEFKSSNEKKVRDFTDKLIKHTKEYLIKTHSRIDKDLPFESQLNGIEFLRTKHLISDNDFEKLKNKLLGKDGNSNSVGFEKTTYNTV